MKAFQSFFLPASVLCFCGVEKTKPRPNILFIFTDDLGADALGTAGNSIFKIPNIYQLAQVGTHFINA